MYYPFRPQAMQSSENEASINNATAKFHYKYCPAAPLGFQFGAGEHFRGRLRGGSGAEPPGRLRIFENFQKIT